MVTAVGAPAQADWVPPFRKCTAFDQGGFKGEACIDRIGLGPQEIFGIAKIETYPSNCAKFRIQVIDPDNSRVVRTKDNVACGPGRFDSPHYLFELMSKGRGFARLTSFDSAGNTLFSIDTEILKHGAGCGCG